MLIKINKIKVLCLKIQFHWNFVNNTFIAYLYDFFKNCSMYQKMYGVLCLRRLTICFCITMNIWCIEICIKPCFLYLHVTEFKNYFRTKCIIFIHSNIIFILTHLYRPKQQISIVWMSDCDYLTLLCFCFFLLYIYQW